MDGWWQLVIVCRRRKWLLAREDITGRGELGLGSRAILFYKANFPPFPTLEDWTWFFFFFQENGHFLYNPSIACGSNKLPLWDTNQKEINSSGNDTALSNKKKLLGGCLWPRWASVKHPIGWSGFVPKKGFVQAILGRGVWLTEYQVQMDSRHCCNVSKLLGRKAIGEY